MAVLRQRLEQDPLRLKLVMPALVAGIHVLVFKDVDGRDKPGHDEREALTFPPSCPALCVGVRKHAVLRTAMPGHDDSI
jgi:hypothetical protein